MIPSPWFTPLPSPGRSLKETLRVRRPGRRQSALGRQRVRRQRAGSSPGALAPPTRVQRPLWGGCGAAVSSACLCPLLGLRGSGGGRGRGTLVPWRCLKTAAGGRPGGSGPGGQPSAGGSHSSPAPLYLARTGRSCRPSLGFPAPLAVAGRRWPAGGGREGQRSAVSGLRGSGFPSTLVVSALPPTGGGARSSVRPYRGGGGGRGARLRRGGGSHGTVPPPLSRIRRLGRHLRRALCGGWGCGGGGFRRR